jgi:hypothetical protein
MSSMSPHPADTMSRLAAADPARNAIVEESERERLWQLIAATPSAPEATPSTPLRRRERACGCAGWRW